MSRGARASRVACACVCRPHRRGWGRSHNKRAGQIKGQRGRGTGAPTDRARRGELMPTREVASAPKAPVPARACTGRACTGNAVAGTARPAGSAQRLRLRRRPAEAEAACRPFGPTDATGPIAWSTCRSPPPRPPRASTVSAAGAPRLQKSCRWRRPQSKGRSCGSGRARRDLRVRGGRGHLSERPRWPRGAPIARGSTISIIALGGRRVPHRSGSRCRGRPIERREAGADLCRGRVDRSEWSSRPVGVVESTGRRGRVDRSEWSSRPFGEVESTFRRGESTNGFAESTKRFGRVRPI